MITHNCLKLVVSRLIQNPKIGRVYATCFKKRNIVDYDVLVEFIRNSSTNSDFDWAEQGLSKSTEGPWAEAVPIVVELITQLSK